VTRIVARTGGLDLVDLPWAVPLAEWRDDRIVHIPRGAHRHVVRFANVAGVIYALKELPDHLVDREYEMLSFLGDEQVPAVEPAAKVTRRPDLDGILVTEHLQFSVPYRFVLPQQSSAPVREQLLDAMAGLLVRLHLVGFYWGDGSLSNTLFRRDAGVLAAYVVDVETSEVQPALSNGLRERDLEITLTNVLGGLLDLGAAGRLPPELDPLEVCEELRSRYDGLWHELTHDEQFGPGEWYRIDERLRRLNELGFDVSELELALTDDGTYELRLDPRVVEPGRHARELGRLTGLAAGDKQARSLLNDIGGYQAYLERARGESLPFAIAAGHWLHDVYHRALGMVPAELSDKLEANELFLAMLDHWHDASTAAGEDLDLFDAVVDYVRRVLPGEPDRRTVVDLDPT